MRRPKQSGMARGSAELTGVSTRCQAPERECDSYPLLGNSNRGLSPYHKRTLYTSCVLPILTYGYCLWYNPKKPQKTLIKSLAKSQAAAARWIIGAFRTSPVGGMEILASLLPIHIHLRRLYQMSVIRYQTLPASHILPFTATPHVSHVSHYSSAYHVRKHNPKLN